MAANGGGVMRVMGHTNYRLYWFGFLISNAGAWIQSVAQGWLVYELSDSAAWLGAVGFARAFPLIFLSLLGGTLADRMPKRRILYVTQTIQMLTALVLGLLTSLGVVQVWHVIAMSLVSAMAQAFDQPTRHSMLPILVAKEDLHGAISLNAIAFNGAALFGPSLTGILVPLIGLAGCFYVNAVSFAAVFLALAAMNFPDKPSPTMGRSVLSDLMEGLQYIKRSPITLALISMAGVTSFFARPYQQFITVFARDVLGGSISLAGTMQAAPALGTVTFMVLITSMGNMEWKGKLLVGAGFAFTLFLILFSWSTNIYLSMALLVLAGGFNMTWQTTINTLLQENTPNEMRGRVMAAYTITALAMMPLGQGPMGVAMERLGPARALSLGGVISLAFIAYMSLWRVKRVVDLH